MRTFDNGTSARLTVGLPWMALALWAGSAGAATIPAGSFDDRLGTSVVVLPGFGLDFDDHAVGGAALSDRSGGGMLDSGSAGVFSSAGAFEQEFQDDGASVATGSGLDDEYGASLASSRTASRVLLFSGVPLADAAGILDSGAVHYRELDGTPSGAIENPNANASTGEGFDDRFGTSISAYRSWLVVGAPGADADAGSGPVLDSGAVFVYATSGLPAAPTFAEIPNPSTTTGDGESDAFGSAVAVGRAALVPGTRSLIAIGAPLADAGGVLDSGRVYVVPAGGPYTAPIAIDNPTPGFDDRFGESVAVTSQFVVVGVPLADTGGAIDSGLVRVFDHSGAQVATITDPAPGSYDHFGATVSAVDETLLLIGEPLADVGGVVDAGLVHRAMLSSSAPIGLIPGAPPLQDATPGFDDEFGASADSREDLLVIGVPLEDDGSDMDEGQILVSLRNDCGDGLDNDGDGGVDGADPGCGGSSSAFRRENPECSDGYDNDGDGKVDYDVNPLVRDSACTAPHLLSETQACGMLGVESLLVLAVTRFGRRRRASSDSSRRG